MLDFSNGFYWNQSFHYWGLYFIKTSKYYLSFLFKHLNCFGSLQLSTHVRQIIFLYLDVFYLIQLSKYHYFIHLYLEIFRWIWVLHFQILHSLKIELSFHHFHSCLLSIQLNLRVDFHLNWHLLIFWKTFFSLITPIEIKIFCFVKMISM